MRRVPVLALLAALLATAFAPPAEAGCIIKHIFTSVKADGADATLVRPSNWNDCLLYSGGSNGQFVVIDTTDATYRTGFTTGLSYLSNLLTSPSLTLSGTGVDTLRLASPNARVVEIGDLDPLAASPSFWNSAMVVYGRVSLTGNTTDIQSGLTVEVKMPNFTATALREKAAIVGRILTQKVTSGADAADAVGIIGQGIISSTTTGTAWGMLAEATINTGSDDGTAYGIEVGNWNAGSVQTAVDTTTSKYGIWLANHTNKITAAIALSSSTPGWHYGLYMRKAQTFIDMTVPLASGAIALDVHDHANWDTSVARLPNNRFLAWYDSGATIRPLLGLDSGNNLVLGGPMGGAGSILALRPGLGESVSVQSSSGASTFATFTSALTTINTAVAAGTTPATAGTYRIPNTGTLSGRNAANSANITLIELDASNQVKLRDGAWLLDGSNHLIPSTDAAKDLGTSALRVRSGYFSTSVSVGTNPATAGGVRLKNSSGGEIEIRNNANSADLIVLDLDTSDQLVLGRSLASGKLYINASGTVKNVTEGAADSCTVGFKCLRVPN